MALNTAFLLMAEYNRKEVIPLNDVFRDYFSHPTTEEMLRKVNLGEVAILFVRMESSQKSAKGAHLQDLADYLNARRLAVPKEQAQLNARRVSTKEESPRYWDRDCRSESNRETRRPQLAPANR